METLKSEPHSPRHLGETKDWLFDLPEVPPDFQETPRPAPTWEQQMAHTQLLRSWRKIQGLDDGHPPRCAVRFVM